MFSSILFRGLDPQGGKSVGLKKQEKTRKKKVFKVFFGKTKFKIRTWWVKTCCSEWNNIFCLFVVEIPSSKLEGGG